MKNLILAIDDSKAIRFLLQTVLGKHYQVVTASRWMFCYVLVI